VPQTSARRRVLLVNNSLATGGLERQLVLLAQHLPDTWEARLWTMEGGPYAGPVRDLGVPWMCCPRRSRLDPSPAVVLSHAMRTWRPDVVHAWHWMAALAALPASLVLGVPLVDGSIRMGSVPRTFGRPRRSIMRWATIVVANSQSGLDAWRVRADKGRVIYNAFDRRRLDGTGSSAPAPEAVDGRFTVVMAARMDPQKDYAAVIRAARLLDERDPGCWRFLLVGEGRDRAALKEAASDLVATGAVSFQSPGLEALQAIRSADAGILMTDPAVLTEGCSNALLEYMACGLPIVCADTGGCPELVREGQEGYLVAPYDDVALATRLADLRADRALRQRMGEAGRTRVERQFTLNRMVEAYLRVYEEAVLRSRRSR
jgi:glycosyltransferase involved in cell wall biosynthesis